MMTLIIEAGISSDDKAGWFYQLASAGNALIKSDINKDKEGGFLTQHLYSKKSVFMDFLAPGAYDCWKEGLKKLYTLIPFDGVHHELNEPVGFCNGECPDGEPAPKAYSKYDSSFLEADGDKVENKTWYQSYSDQSEISTYKMPFIPGDFNLDNMTLSLNGTHPSGYKQYDLHNINGHLQGKMTKDILANQTLNPVDKRPFILSRSTFAGSGKYMQHWIGGDQGSWMDLRYTIAQVMNFNMFGIPLTGSNVCGFKGYGDEGKTEDDMQELCARQMQLATFMPIARQRIMDEKDNTTNFHNKDIYMLKEPYKTMSVNAMFERLRYQRLLYTCLFDAQMSGESCVEPLFFHYPTDDETYKDMEHSFMYANALKVTPVLEKGAKTVKSYFPKGHWVNMNDFKDIKNVKTGEWIDIPVPENENIVH